MEPINPTDSGRDAATGLDVRWSLKVSREMDAAVERFRREDARPTMNNAVIALLLMGLQAHDRRKPLRPRSDAGPAENGGGAGTRSDPPGGQWTRSTPRRESPGRARRR